MLTFEDVEKIVPHPVKLEIGCDSGNFKCTFGDELIKVLENHNKKYDTKIECIPKHFWDLEDEDCKLQWNEYEIYVGNELIYKGTVLAELDSRLKEVLNSWHDKIVELQEENKRKIEQFEQDGYDELLYIYYRMRAENKAFCYLKRLASRYPNSIYRNTLRRVYRQGLYGWHAKSISLARKLQNKYDGKMF